MRDCCLYILVKWSCVCHLTKDVEKLSLFAEPRMCLQSNLFDVYLGPMAIYMHVIILPSFHHGVPTHHAVSAFQPSITLPEAHACMPACTSNVCQRPCKHHTRQLGKLHCRCMALREQARLCCGSA